MDSVYRLKLRQPPDVSREAVIFEFKSCNARTGYSWIQRIERPAALSISLIDGYIDGYRIG